MMKQKTRAFLSLLIAFALALATAHPTWAGAADSDAITVSFTLLGDEAHGDNGERHTYAEDNLTTWIETQDVVIDSEATLLDAFEQTLAANGLTWDAPVSEYGAYIDSVTKDGVTIGGGTNGMMSGWLYLVNDESPWLGVSEQTLRQGDRIVFHYTDDFNIDSNYLPIRSAFPDALDYLQAQITAPTVGSVGGEWAAIALNRGNRKDAAWNAAYLDALESYIQTKAHAVDPDTGEVTLHRNYITDNERVILALTAMGVDATQFRGYDLVSALLRPDGDGGYAAKKQGVTGVAYALLALNSGNYASSEDGAAFRIWCVNYLMEHKINNGGWDFTGSSTGTADPDVTSIVMCALAPYYLAELASPGDAAEEKSIVVDAISQAITTLQDLQRNSGGFGYATAADSSESTAEVIMALTAIGYVDTWDNPFLGNAVANLLGYRDEATGGFRHEADDSVNIMASEKAACALVAYSRHLLGGNALYDMRHSLEAGTTRHQYATKHAPRYTAKRLSRRTAECLPTCAAERFSWRTAECLPTCAAERFSRRTAERLPTYAAKRFSRHTAKCFP